MATTRELLQETFLRETQNLGALLSDGRFPEAPARTTAKPADIIAYAISAYRDTRVAGADLDNGDDLLRLQWGCTKPSGTWEPSGLATRPSELVGKEPPLRYLDLTRELRTFDSDAHFFSGIVQLSVTIFYDSHKAADRSETITDICVRNPEDLTAAVRQFEHDPFVAELLTQPAYIIIATTPFGPGLHAMGPRNPFIRIEPRYLEPPLVLRILYDNFFFVAVIAPPTLAIIYGPIIGIAASVCAIASLWGVGLWWCRRGYLGAYGLPDGCASSVLLLTFFISLVMFILRHFAR